MRFFCFLAAALLAAAPLAAQEIPVPEDASWRAVEIVSAPWRIRGDAPAEAAHTVGKLIYRGGVALTSPDPAFGGYSGLLVSEDRTRLLAVSDRGQWLEAAIEYDANGRLSGLTNGRKAAVVDKDGVVLAGPVADAESLATSGDGRLFVSFEREHRIDAYRIDDDGMIVFDFRLVDFADDPPPYNDGVEAVAVLDDGVLALSEKPFASGADGFLIVADGARLRLAYKGREEYAVTAAERLGDTLYILERAWSPLKGVRARLLRAPLPAADRRTIRPEALAHFRPPYVIDNMEGLDARIGPNGETLLYVMSDDNHSARQKTILMMFEVME